MWFLVVCVAAFQDSASARTFLRREPGPALVAVRTDFHPGAQAAGELRFKRLQRKRLQAQAATPVSTANTSALAPAPADFEVETNASDVANASGVTSVWVVGWGRSGTTLAMDLLGAGTRNVFTLYEPCHIGGNDVYRGNIITAANVQQICPELLVDVLRCDFTGMQGMRHLAKTSEHNEGKLPEFFSPEAMRKQCLEATMRVVKTVHIDESVMSTTGVSRVLRAVPKLKVVSVVRDPRAVYSSRQQCHAHWHKSWLNTQLPLLNRMCAQLEAAYLWPVQFSGRVHTLRYETLVAEPVDESTRVLQFLGLAVGTPRVTRWLREHMGAEACPGEDGDTYGTCRTPAQQHEALTKWQRLLSADDKAHADVVCANALRYFNYAV